MDNNPFKYQGVKNHILESIRNKKFKFGDKLPSENVLCRKFGLSRQTVRRAMEELQEEGYVFKKRGSGSYVGKITASGLSNTIGILVSHISDYLFAQIINGVEEVISNSGYGLDLGLSNNSIALERKFLQRILDSNVAGLIVEGTRSALPNPNLDFYVELKRREIPIVFIHNYYEDIPCPSVLMDDVNISKDMTNMLLKAGHRDISGIFKGDDLQGLRRYNGYVKALCDADIPVREEIVGWFYSNYYDNVFLEMSVQQVIHSMESYTAMICYNDLIAQEVYNLYRKSGMDIPEHLSIVSFDDLPIAQYIANGITSGPHPKKLLGIEAATRLLRMINEGMEAVPPKPYLMPYEILLRDSIRKI